MAICLVFFYLPILVTMIFSFNSSKSLTRFTGFSMRWYTELLHNTEVSKAVYVSVTIAILATVISTVLGTITAIGLSKSRKVLKETLLNINNLPILNPDIVTAIGLMLLFSSLGFRKGYFTMLLAHISFCTPYVITSVYPRCEALIRTWQMQPWTWSNSVPGIDQGNRAHDQGWHFRRCAAGIYHVL